ncbi:DUF4469 domain-containing protein [Bacteroides stercorirosoris]|uniref:DUF4469 domain-containing protein n=1 Tax=Bacteroides stercorirosoris TaxID=871324 RepID=UPI00216AC8D7|nr:DUF4469 domain-containing protein [Bacteroides stercorirosoris]
MAGTDPAVGVTFTSVETPSKKVFVPAEDVTINEPKRLIFVLPATVTDGLWRVSISTQYGSGSSRVVKNLRTYELDEPIAVGTAAEEGGSGSGGGQGGGGGIIDPDPLG